MQGRGNVAAERFCGALFVGVTTLKGYFYNQSGRNPSDTDLGQGQGQVGWQEYSGCSTKPASTCTSVVVILTPSPLSAGTCGSATRAYLNPTFGPGVFDHLRSLFRRLGTGSDSRSFVVKDATRLAPKELIHRHAKPVRMIHLDSKGLVERTLDRLCCPFDHRDRKTLSGKFGLGLFPQPNFHKIESLFGRSLGNQPAVNAAKDIISFTLAALNLGEEKPTELGLR